MIYLRLLVLCLMGMTATSWSAAADQPPAIRAGVASMITPVSAVKYYQQVVDYVGRKLDMPAEMVHRTTYNEIDLMLENHSVDFAFICSSPYVLNKEKFGVELLVAPQVNGKISYQSIIIVHKDSVYETFDQLKDRTFAFVDPKSNTGKLYPTYLLAKHDQTPEGFFASYLFSYSHNKSVELVAKKRAEAAAVDSLVYDFMVATRSPYAEQTRIIHRSPQFGIPPVVVPPGLPFYLKESLRNIFLSMHQDPEGRQILKQMKIEQFVEISDSSYDSIRAMRAFIDNNRLSSASQKNIDEQPPASEQVVLFGVLPRDNPIIAYERYQPLMDYLSRVTGTKTELHLEKSYQALVGSLGSGKISFALLGPLTYLDAFKKYQARPIARSRTADGDSFFHSVIAVNSESGIEKIDQLNKRSFAFAALWSTSGNLIPRYMLAWSGIHLDNLSTYRHYNYHDTVAKKIISNEYDAGALRRTTADRYLSYGLRVIAVSDPIPTGPVVASPYTSRTLTETFQQALLHISDNSEGRIVLDKLDPDLQGGFVVTSDADYGDIRKMINDVPTGCAINCHPKVSF